MGNLLQDLRYGLRMLYRNPGFAAVAILSLALGISANTTIFSLVNAILLRPLPVTEPDRLVKVYAVAADGSGFHTSSYPDYVDYRDRNSVFSELTAYSPAPLNLSTGSQPERTFGMIVSGNYFSVLGVRPALGRFFLPEEDKTPGAHPVAVVSHSFWQRRFGGKDSVLGQTIRINGNQFTIVGVAPEGFKGTQTIFSPNIWVPLMMLNQAAPHSGGDRLNVRGPGGWLEMTGRLKPGVSVAQADADLRNIAAQLAQTYPDSNRGESVELHPEGTVIGPMRGAVIGFMGLLMTVVALVLLIACANIASMLLARAMVRRREVAIRLAMGAGRARLIRQLITETLLLFIFGAIVGILMAIWMSKLLLAFSPPTPFPLALDLQFDARVLGFTVILSLVTGLICGLVPALQASKVSLVPALKGEDSAAGSGRSRLRSLFVIGQVATSLVLLIAAGLLIRSMRNAQTIDPGFSPENVSLMSLNTTLQGYSNDKSRDFYRQLVERVAARPGVQSVSVARMVPLGGANQTMEINVQGFTPPPNTQGFTVDFNTVTPGYFQTMKIPLLRGRDFDKTDVEGAPLVAIINETMAQRFWPGEDPVGKQFYRPTYPNGRRVDTMLTVVGVAKNGKYRTLDEDPRLYVYLPYSQNYEEEMTLHVRTNGSETGIVNGVRHEVQMSDKDLPLYDVKSLTEHMSVSLLPTRMAATLLGILGLFGLVLAGVGIYGLLAYSVAQRTHEIGIRMALGAQARDVLRLIVGQAMSLVIIGAVIGLVISFALTRVMSNLLYGISANDPLTFGGVTLLLVVIALIASYVPARRAMKVDPMVALRHE